MKTYCFKGLDISILSDYKSKSEKKGLNLFKEIAIIYFSILGYIQLFLTKKAIVKLSKTAPKVLESLINSNVKIVIFQNAYDVINKKTVANYSWSENSEIIYLKSSIFCVRYTEYSFLHEVGHFLDRHVGLKNKKDFMSLVDLKLHNAVSKDFKKIISSKYSNIKYTIDNIREYMAECFAYYIYEGAKIENCTTKDRIEAYIQLL